MIDKNYNYAIVGASNNPEKYGYRVMKDLLDAGYNVIPVNLKESEILGRKAYPRLEDIGENIDVVITLVPPAITEKIVRQIKDLNIQNVWMQPGSESEESISYCKQNNINCVHQACIMIKRKED